MIYIYIKKKASVYLFTVDQPHQALTAADVITDMTVGKPVNHVAIIHHVSGEKKLIFTIM